jgi:hypothetical protein
LIPRAKPTEKLSVLLPNARRRAFAKPGIVAIPTYVYSLIIY